MRLLSVNGRTLKTMTLIAAMLARVTVHATTAVDREMRTTTDTLDRLRPAVVTRRLRARFQPRPISLVCLD